MKKIVIAGSILGGLAIIAAFVVRAKRKKLEASIKEGSPDVVVASKSTINSVVFPLKQGSGKTTAENNAVKVVQRYLNQKSANSWLMTLAPLKEDGLFGPLTEASLTRVHGVKQVSFSLYKEMEAFLTPVLLSPNAPAYKANSTDPTVVKNNLLAVSQYKILP